MLENDIKNKIINKIVKKVNPFFIILFGSFAKGTVHADSDLDLAYFAHRELSPYDRFTLAGELAMIINRDVDLVDIKQIDTVFMMRIFGHGIPIYVQDKNEFHRQRMRAYSMYATLSEQRLLRRFRREGVSLGMSDIVLNKVTTIERCINRIYEVYEGNPENLENLTKQDSIVLNIQRACEASIDLAMHVVAERKLGIPKASREGFDFLQEANIIEGALTRSLINMVGFCNIAIHDYQTLNLVILQSILEKHLDDFKSYSKIILQLEKEKL